MGQAGNLGPKMQKFGNTTGIYRVNVLDCSGTISFLAPSHGLKVLAASASRGAETGQQLLHVASGFDAQWADSIKHALLLFDEHNVDQLDPDWQERIETSDSACHPVFRVIDEITRHRSLRPAVLGLAVFNLREHRIIQVQNWYDKLRRKDRGRIRINGEPTEVLFHYELPRHWSLVP